MLTILTGDWREKAREIADGSVQCCVTSPPYFGLRDYGVAGQIGLEPTPAEYVAEMVKVFREVRRCLADDGTLWLNLGDSYANDGKWGGPTGGKHVRALHGSPIGRNKKYTGMKPKDLIGIPWRVAFALQADGWWLRSDIIWAKPNCMPESVRDRPTRSHEYIFLLSKSKDYYYDAEAIKERAIYDVDGTGTASRKARDREDLKSFPANGRSGIRPAGFKDPEKFNGKNGEKQAGHSRRHDGFNARWDDKERTTRLVLDENGTHHGQNARRLEAGSFANNKADRPLTGVRNKRDVWWIAPACYPEAHFATFPTDLIRPCVLAGSRARDTVLDPFGGSGTTGQVALELGRHAVLCELNPAYVKLIEQRCAVTPGLALA